MVPGDLRHSRAAASGARREGQIGREADGERPRRRIRRSVSLNTPGKTQKTPVHLHFRLNSGFTARMGSRVCRFLSCQDLVTQNAVTAAARGPARSTASRVCTFSSSSRTTQGWLHHTQSRRDPPAASPFPSVHAECVCPSAPGGSGATGGVAKNATPPARAARGAAATSAAPVGKAITWWTAPARARPPAGKATTWTTVTSAAASGLACRLRLPL